MKYLALFFLAATAAYGQNLSIRPGAEIRFFETDTTHYVGLKGPAVVSSSFVWTLPATDGTAGQALLTNGSGTFYWGAGGSGGALADGDYGDFTVSGGGTVATIDDGIQIDDLTTNDEAYSLTWNGSLEVATKNALYDKIVTLADPNTAVAWFDNIRQTFNPGALQPGFNVGSHAGNPSSPINGDIWYNSVSNELNARINGASVALGAGGGGSSLTDTYVGYGDGSNALTGEAAFHYNATTNLLTVPGVSTPALTATSANTREFYIQDSGDDDYLKIDISTDLASARTLTLTVPDADTTMVVPGSMTVAGVGYANLWADGVKQTFNPGATTAGINVGSIAGDPSGPANGDLWYDSTANELTARINGVNVAINEVPPWVSGSFTGTADYTPGTLYVGTMAAPATLSFSTIGSGDKVGFVITATDADAADRTITFPTASIVGSGSSGTTFVLPQNVDTFLEFLYDGTDLFLLQTHSMASPSINGVGTLGGTWVDTPAAMGANVVDITKANNTKTLAANATFTWSATPSVSGQSWGGEFQNSSGAEVTCTMPSCKNAFGGATVTEFTIAAGGLENVFWRYNGTDVIFFGGGGSGTGSGFPLTANADFAGFNAINIGDLTATTVTSSLADSTNVPAPELEGLVPDLTFSKITTPEAIVRTPTPVSGNAIDTTLAYSVMTADGAAETITYTGPPDTGANFWVMYKAFSADTTFTIPTTFSRGLDSNRVSFVVPANKFCLVSYVWDGTVYHMDGEWITMSNLPDDTTPATTAKVQIDQGSGLESTTLANIKTALSLDDAKLTRTGVRRTIYVNAAAMIPRTTNGAARATTELATNDIMVDSMDFDTTTEEGVGFWLSFPSTYNSSTVTVKFHWTASSSTGTVKWDVAARGFVDDDAMDQAMGTEQTAGADTLLATGDMHISATTPALTIGGTVSPDRPNYFQITRDVAGDTLAADAQLLGVTVEYTESSTEPAAQ